MRKRSQHSQRSPFESKAASPLLSRLSTTLTTTYMRQVVATLPTGQLDGLVLLSEDEVLISSRECGCVYAGPPKGPFVSVVENVPSPADIGWDSQRQQLLIPLFHENAILIYPTAKTAADN